MEINLEKEVALLTKRLQEETTKSIRYQALLDDALEELKKYNNESQNKETIDTVEQSEEPKFHVVEDDQ